MNPTCSYKHVSYTTLRLQILRRLCATSEAFPEPQLLFLKPRPDHPINIGRRQFHTSSPRARNNVKDVRRSARYRVAQLELSESGKDAVEDAAHSRPPVSSSKSMSNSQRWNPYGEDSIDDLQDLVSDLRTMAKGAREKAKANLGDESIPFESSILLSRKNPNLPESPLERKMRWERDKKLQVHEVDIDKRLTNNVWAQILASPMRLDRGTKARLPRDLTASWGIMQNPNDDQHYLLPIELSDIEALSQEIQQSVNSSDSDGINRSQPQPGTRIQVTANRFLLEAMTADVTVKKFSRDRQLQTRSTVSGRLAGSLIPQRWKFKQEEMQAFHRTRENFNSALDRQPDDDEPDMDELAKFKELQWQPDITDRMQKMMNERILIVLEAVARANNSTRAIRRRNVVAIPVPREGQLWVDDQGRVSDNRPTTQEIKRIQAQEIEEAVNSDWIHGAIILHIGSSTAFYNTTEQWHQAAQADSSMPEMPQKNKLVPPTISINQQYNLPVFNLETLLSPTHSSRMNVLISSVKAFDLDFWQGDDKSRKTRSSPSPSSTGFESDIKSSISTHEVTIPESSLDAGERVFSSIITPNIESHLSQGDSPQVSPPTQSSNQVEESSEKEKMDKGYLLIVKPRAQHAVTLIREVWQLWRFIGGWKGLGGLEDRIERGSG